MKNYQFTDDEINELKMYRNNSKDIHVRNRLFAMLILVENDIEYAASIVGVVPKTIQNWLQKYTTGGISELIQLHYKPKKHRLTFFQLNQIYIWVSFEYPGTTKEIQNYILEKFKIDYSVENVRKLVLKLGLKCIRSKSVPGNPPTVEEQRKFVDDYQVRRAKPGCKNLFIDGMHLVHQNEKSYCWGDPTFPQILETNSSRKRLNIIGAWNPETYSLIHLTGEENCNADRVISLLEKILQIYEDASKIYIYVDNARYFWAKKVQEWIDRNGKIKCIFLPPYSPNLNLIERFWKFAKKKLVKRTYYAKYKTFRAKTFQFLNNVKKYRDELKTLMVEKFQTIYA